MCYSTKLTQNSSFIKVRRNITRLPETADLLAEEGSTGFGTYIMILLYLTECPDCVGQWYLKASLFKDAFRYHCQSHD